MSENNTGNNDTGDTITWAQFEAVDLRVGTVTHAEVFKEARKPAYVLHVDFGADIGVRKSSAQITKHYQPDDLIGQQVVGVVNFPPKQIGPIRSHCLVTGFYDENGDVVLCQPGKPVPNGSKLG